MMLPAPDRTVVITGIGIVCPLGDAIDDVLKSFNTGRTCFSPSPKLAGTPFAGQMTSRINSHLSPEYERNKLSKFMSLDSKLAFAACGSALKDAGIASDTFDPYRVGLFLGSGITCGEIDDMIPAIENSMGPDRKFSMELFGREGIRSVNPISSFKILNNMPLCLISIGFGIKGPNLILNPWEGESAQAVIEAIESLLSGQVDCAITGAADTKTHLLGLVFLKQAGLLDGGAIDARQGMTPAEGGCFLALERLDSAKKRSARIYAALTGWDSSTSANAHWGYSTDPTQLRDLTMNSIRKSGIPIQEISHVYSGNDGNIEGDSVNDAAIAGAFQPLSVPPSKHPKAVIGNTFAASPFISLALAAREIEAGPSQNMKILVAASGNGPIKGSFVLEKPL